MSRIFGPISTEEQHFCDVFVIMPFRDEFRHVYEQVIEKVCKELNLSVKLGDDFFSNRQIINEVWSAINNCQLVIADCTGRNPNVFYELGIAHALEKHTIQITQQGEDIPFDIRGARYILYTDSIVGARKLADDLSNTIQNMLHIDLSKTDLIARPPSRHPLQARDPRRYQLSLLNDINVLREETRKAYKLDEYEWAVLFAEAWVRAAPMEIRAYEDLGRAAIRANQPDKAITAGKKLVELRRIYHEGYHIVGEAYRLLGDWEQARQWQETALRYVSPDFRQFVLHELAKIYEALGLTDEAIEVLEELIPLVDRHRKLGYEEELGRLKRIRCIVRFLS